MRIKSYGFVIEYFWTILFKCAHKYTIGLRSKDWESDMNTVAHTYKNYMH